MELDDLLSKMIDQGVEYSVAEEIYDYLARANGYIADAFMLRYEGKTYKEIAKILDIDEATAWRYINRDCKEIKNILKETARFE